MQNTIGFTRKFLVLVCLFTLFSTAYLSLSLIILHPPRANSERWLIQAILFLFEGGLTLFAIFKSGPKVLYSVVLIGALAVLCVATLSVYVTFSGPHFEGYALLLGGWLIVQSLLTLPVAGSRLFKA